MGWLEFLTKPSPWEMGAKEYRWHAKDGTIWMLSEMSDEHLANAHKFVLRRLGQLTKAAGKLSSEIERRKKGSK